MKFTHIIILFLFAAYVCPVVAQDEESDEIAELIDYNIVEAGNLINSNAAFIRQSGHENEGILIQQQEGLLSNYSLLKQSGNGNKTYINQQGSAHVTQIGQMGHNNELNSWSVGNASYNFVKQQGNANTINSYIDNQGIIPKAVCLDQNGNNNTINIALLGNGFCSESFPRVAVIKQSGHNLEFNAIMDSYHSPILVEQQSGHSGHSGGGMTVTISNSAFNFPTK